MLGKVVLTYEGMMDPKEIAHYYTWFAIDVIQVFGAVILFVIFCFYIGIWFDKIFKFFLRR